jgi:tetratricopeptide (TPR) repeat protein
MGRIEKTVFISYRRTNVPWALAVYQHLTGQGYDVFFDYLSIPSGDFESVILENIRGRAHFIVILTPSALERCAEPGDWLRREIETAIDEKRNIVPLMLESFDFGSPAAVKALTGKLSNLQRYNALRVPSEYFFEAMDRLRKQYLNVALEAVVHPVSEAVAQVVEEHKAAASEAKEVEKTELTAQEWFEKGYVFAVEARNYPEAIRCYSEAIRLKPDYANAHNNRGQARGSSNDLQGALADYDAAIRIKPDYATAYSNRGLARASNSNLQGALADYEEAIRLRPGYANAYNNRGLARISNNDLQGALADFDEAIRLKPDYANAHYHRGFVHQLTGDLDYAARDYEESIRLKLGYRIARASLIGVLRKLGRNAEAEQQEKLAREMIARDNEYNQACFEAICGNTEMALELLRTGLEKGQATKELARLDPDFESLRSDPRFIEIVGG